MIRPHRLTVRTSPLQGGNMGSTPIGAAFILTRAIDILE